MSSESGAHWLIFFLCINYAENPNSKQILRGYSKSFPNFTTQYFLQRNGLKVHKNENFFGFDFEFCPISLLVMHK
jgi:hypothetical protein